MLFNHTSDGKDFIDSYVGSIGEHERHRVCEPLIATLRIPTDRISCWLASTNRRVAANGSRFDCRPCCRRSIFDYHPVGGDQLEIESATTGDQHYAAPLAGPTPRTVIVLVSAFDWSFQPTSRHLSPTVTSLTVRIFGIFMQTLWVHRVDPWNIPRFDRRQGWFWPGFIDDRTGQVLIDRCLLPYRETQPHK